MIWDDHAGRCIGELSFRSQVFLIRGRSQKQAAQGIFAFPARVGNLRSLIVSFL